MFKAYSVGLQERDFELIRKIVKIITTEHVSVKDLRYYDIKSEDTDQDILFVFGDKASRLVEGIRAKEIVHLPEIATLHANTGVQGNRKEAFKKLNLLKVALETDTLEVEKEPVLESPVLEDPVPELELSDLKILESTLKEKEVNNWRTTTASGKTIQISITPEVTEADMNITFCELYALKIAMDALNIREFTVVYNNKANKGNHKESNT